MKTIYLFLVIVGMVFSTISCSNNEEFFEPGDSNEATIAYKNNMLHFPSQEVLQKVLSNKLEIPLVTSFSSQKDLFDKIIEEEYNHALSLKDLSDEEYEKQQVHSEEYLKALKESFIKEEVYEDNTTLYDLNLALPSYAKILNKDGFYAVKDTIFQITSTELKAWENCKVLADTNKVSYKIKYTKTPLTKSLFPLQAANQSVAFATYTENAPWDRVILTFLDETKLAIPNVTRDIYIRTSFQRKVDGRNFTYMPAPFSITAFFDLIINGETKNIMMTTNGTGANEWYTVYLEYEFLNPGKTTQTYTETYYYIKKLTLETIYSVSRNGKNDNIQVRFDGYREGDLYGKYNYYPYMGQPFYPLLPDE